MNKYTYREIASDYNLWSEYVDPSGHDTEAEFNAKTAEEKLVILVSCFGPEKLTGLAAIEAAEKDSTIVLCKHADPTEDAREGLTPSEARDIAREDAGLIYARLK